MNFSTAALQFDTAHQMTVEQQAPMPAADFVGIIHRRFVEFGQAHPGRRPATIALHPEQAPALLTAIGWTSPELPKTLEIFGMTVIWDATLGWHGFRFEGEVVLA